jgi:HSP20 family protein
MNIWTWRPAGWDPLGELQRQVDRLFDFTADMSRQIHQTWRQFPAFNLYEANNEFYVVAPMAGLQPEDLDISVTGTTLTLKGERKRPANVAEEHYRRQERWHGKWSRTIQLPENADPNQIAATIDNGVLTLRILKVPEGQPRQVPVSVASGQGNVCVN